MAASEPDLPIAHPYDFDPKEWQYPKARQLFYRLHDLRTHAGLMYHHLKHYISTLGQPPLPRDFGYVCLQVGMARSRRIPLHGHRRLLVERADQYHHDRETVLRALRRTERAADEVRPELDAGVQIVDQMRSNRVRAVLTKFGAITPDPMQHGDFPPEEPDCVEALEKWGAELGDWINDLRPFAIAEATANSAQPADAGRNVEGSINPQSARRVVKKEPSLAVKALQRKDRTLEIEDAIVEMVKMNIPFREISETLTVRFESKVTKTRVGEVVKKHGGLATLHRDANIRTIADGDAVEEFGAARTVRRSRSVRTAGHTSLSSEDC